MAEYKIFLLALLIALLLITQPTGGLSPSPVSVRAAPQYAPPFGDVVISQFRFRGSGGAKDEFVELFNRTCSPIDVSGWHLDFGTDTGPSPSSVILYTFPSSTSLPGGSYYLLANAGYNDTTPDQPFSDDPDIPDVNGVALIRPDTPDPTIIDAVGTSSSDYHEGTPLPPLTTNEDIGYKRITVDSGPDFGKYTDTNNNAADFSSPLPSSPHSSSDTGTCDIPEQTISGNVGVGSATLNWTNGEPQTALPDGSYTLSVPWNWSGTVTPSLPGYSFSPSSRTYSNVVADLIGQDYTETPLYTISGTILNVSGGAGVAGVKLSYTDGTLKTVTTDSNGVYSLAVPRLWSGTVTPSKSGYSFSPSSRTYTNLLSNLTTGQGYDATAIKTPTPTVTSPPPSTPSNFNPQLVINEIAYYGVPDNTSADWIELYNTTNSPINLNGWTLEAQDGRPAIDLTGNIPKHGFYLLARGTTAQATEAPTAAPTPACLVFQVSDHVTINQFFVDDVSYSGETLFLVNPANVVEDYANRNGGSWPAGTFTHSATMERTGGNKPEPDSDTAWLTYADSPVNFVHDCHGNRVYGTPGYQNWAFNLTPTPTPKPTKTPTTRPPTAAPKVVINEFLPRAGFDWNHDGKVDTNDEFIELLNLGPINVDLKNWKLDDEANLGSSPFTLPSQILKPGDRAVYYGSQTRILLDDSGDSVRVINSFGVVVDARTYGVVAEPDQSHCRFPDGYYWRLPCFPTPGTENALTGFVPAAPPSAASKPPICLLADTVPDPFRQAECAAFGADMVNGKYWNDQAGLEQFPVRDNYSKWKTRVE